MRKVRTQWEAYFSAVWATALRDKRISHWCLIGIKLINPANSWRSSKQLTFNKLLFVKEARFDYTDLKTQLALTLGTVKEKNVTAEKKGSSYKMGEKK